MSESITEKSEEGNERRNKSIGKKMRKKSIVAEPIIPLSHIEEEAQILNQAYDRVKTKRDMLSQEVDAEESYKNTLASELRLLTDQLYRINENIQQKRDLKAEFEKTMTEAQATVEKLKSEAERTVTKVEESLADLNSKERHLKEMIALDAGEIDLPQEPPSNMLLPKESDDNVEKMGPVTITMPNESARDAVNPKRRIGRKFKQKIT